MSSPQETNTGATRLAWSTDDDDDLFSAEDEKFSSGGGWEDSYDVDEDLDVSLERKEETNNSDDPVANNSDGVTETAMGSTDEHETATGSNSPTVTATPTPIPLPLPTHLSGGRHPSSHSKIAYSKGGISSISATNSATDDRVLNTPNNILSTISGSTDSGNITGNVTPLSLALVGTPGTPLVELDDGDEQFEEIVRKRNRDRKQREDYHIAHIKVQMGRLEDALAAETKRRVDATTALDEMARTQVHEMEERVRGQLREENEKLQLRLGTLEERVRTLEQNWGIDSNNQIELVNSKAADIGKSMSQIREDQDMERKARLKRESILLQQVEAHSMETEDRWTSERNDRIQRLEELEDQIVQNEARLVLEQKRYEDRIEMELTSLKEELTFEAIERQAQDEEIVAALNRYTQQLQQSLSILSSD